MANVTIYTKRLCGFCFAVKRLLDSLGVKYNETSVDGHPELRRRLAEENEGWRTVPMVFVGDRFLGGFSDLSRLHAEGRLVPILEEAGGALPPERR